MTTSPIFSSGVRTHRYRVALNAGGVRAGRHLASRLTYITTFRSEQRHVLVTVISRNQLPDRSALASSPPAPPPNTPPPAPPPPRSPCRSHTSSRPPPPARPNSTGCGKALQTTQSPPADPALPRLPIAHAYMRQDPGSPALADRPRPATRRALPPRSRPSAQPRTVTLQQNARRTRTT